MDRSDILISKKIKKLSEDPINKIFSIFLENNPNPKTELEYTNDYTLLVAVALSAQATDISVNKATKSLFNIVDSPKKMIELGEENLKQYIKTIGLYNSKAKNIIKLSKILVEEYNSIIPNNRKNLESLPGVGQKTASVVMHILFNAETIAVDTHVFRVSNRIGLIKIKTLKQAEKELLKIIPKKWIKGAHHWLILHGRYICKSRKPLCSKCQIRNFCLYDNKQ